MEYIHSKDIFLLMRDTLKLVDRKSMDHGSRVAYYLYKMLECKGGYEKFELADFVFLASLHDIGAYKTENLKDMLQYEFRETMAHSVYGYLVFKNLSPLSELAQIILYHHMDYSQIVTMDYEYKDITACLNLAEKIDIYSTILGDKFDMRRFEKHIGTILSKESFDLFRESVEKYDVLNKVKSGEYKAELDDIAGYMIFTNADKKKSLEMLMYSQGFKGESLVFSAVTGTCIAEILGQKAGLNELEREQLYYGALLHDIGMLAIPNVIMDAPRNLTPEEYKKVKMHVLLAEKVLKNRMAEEVVGIVATHHERCDGSGYPRGLKESQMNRSQWILQLADSVSALLAEKTYRPALDRDEMRVLLRKEAERGKYNKMIVNLFLDGQSEIMDYVQTRMDKTLVTYRKLNQQYRKVSKKLGQS
ncbi:HD domain-containing protein [Parablautia intestinalis]|uniref:HD domain-containing protein n=1 Tax=Parablautia intestinalis TaxID=2320100 RepID=A0A3A9AII8_9FIRM|nr:HD domain-containing phosphohydrolase [Parablautia intestinalis]MDE7047716.1 HD domain-containing protein [Lachnospiraceae bacterium]RKI90854.1 HD domain-containing protein [Parablautia intestinalis]